MAVARPVNAPAAFEIKSAALTLVAVALRTADVAELAKAFAARFGVGGAPFDQDPVAIDLSALRETDATVDFPALLALLREHRMLPIAVRGGSAAQMDAAFVAGLAEAHPHAPAPLAVRGEPAASPAVEAVPAPAAAISPIVAAIPATLSAPRRGALVVDKPLRSGQQVYAKDCDLIVLAAVNFGAEVIADGNIHVYGPMRGRALAGAHGDTAARIFTTCLEPQLVSIAGIYRTTETELPADVLGKPAQIWLDGESLVIEPLVHR